MQAFKHRYSSKHTIDMSCLSAQWVELIRGKSHEKTALMHLHTTALGIRRLSGEREIQADTINDEVIVF
jgi:hypothetical protein